MKEIKELNVLRSKSSELEFKINKMSFWIRWEYVNRHKWFWLIALTKDIMIALAKTR